MLAILPPTAADRSRLVLRKIIRSQITKEQIIEFGSDSRGAFALIESAIQARQNIVVASGAASGKITM